MPDDVLMHRMPLNSVDAEGARPIIESGILKHKTATSADKKTTLLPLVGFARLFREEPWASTWLTRLEEAGILREDVGTNSLIVG